MQETLPVYSSPSGDLKGLAETLTFIAYPGVTRITRETQTAPLRAIFFLTTVSIDGAGTDSDILKAADNSQDSGCP